MKRKKEEGFSFNFDNSDISDAGMMLVEEVGIRTANIRRPVHFPHLEYWGKNKNYYASHKAGYYATIMALGEMGGHTCIACL